MIGAELVKEQALLFSDTAYKVNSSDKTRDYSSPPSSKEGTTSLNSSAILAIFHSLGMVLTNCYIFY